MSNESVSTQTRVDACYAKAIELMLGASDNQTCGELREQLVTEFGEETVRETLSSAPALN